MGTEKVHSVIHSPNDAARFCHYLNYSCEAREVLRNCNCICEARKVLRNSRARSAQRRGSQPAFNMIMIMKPVSAKHLKRDIKYGWDNRGKKQTKVLRVNCL
jgi:hypothetical protein